MVRTVGVLFGGAKSWRIERITRVIMLQQRVSRMRRACVQKSMTGSKIPGDDRTKVRMDSDGAGGFICSVASGSCHAVLVSQKWPK